jgi:hypothetical protein
MSRYFNGIIRGLAEDAAVTAEDDVDLLASLMSEALMPSEPSDLAPLRGAFDRDSLPSDGDFERFRFTFEKPPARWLDF